MNRTMTKNFDPHRREYFLSNDPGAIQPLQYQVIAQMESKQYGSRDIWNVRLALEEGLINAMKQGIGQIRVAYQVNDSEVRIEIEDEGDGFDPENVPDPRLPENLERPGGRGLLLMRSFMSLVEYNQRGNCVTMRKTRSDEGDSDADCKGHSSSTE